MTRMTLILLFLFSTNLFSANMAEENWYFLVDSELRDVYEHFEGRTLEEAIDSLLGKDTAYTLPGNNITIRFNGGANVLYIGKENTLDILVSNETPLNRISIGFEFSSSSGKYDWVEGYGVYPYFYQHSFPIRKIIRPHPEAFEPNHKPWATNLDVNKFPDSILIVGTRNDSLPAPLPAHDSPTLIYSMQIKLPYDTSMVGGKFCVDNILFPDTGSWYFADTNDQKIIPAFRGNPNTDKSDPDAPPVCFEISVDVQCKSQLALLKKEGKTGKAYFPATFEEMRFYNSRIRGRKVENPDHYHGLIYRNGIRMMMVRIDYDGHVQELEYLGVLVHGHRPEGYDLSAYIPINKLPEVCQLNGVKWINPIRHVGTEFPVLNERR
ncbi:MAG: hypothetical protein GF310_08435 [candidate division Zixibacteria bacterium]|nr:hypothetical protein [candidate division Zixibacteria bacterium]